MSYIKHRKTNMSEGMKISDPARLTNDGVRWISAKLNTTANQTPTDRNGFNTNHSKSGKLKEMLPEEKAKMSHYKAFFSKAFHIA